MDNYYLYSVKDNNRAIQQQEKKTSIEENSSFKLYWICKIADCLYFRDIYLLQQCGCIL